MRIAINLALFVLPFVLYFFWLHLKEKSPFLKEHWDRQPVVWLGLFGLVLGGGYFLYHIAYQVRDTNVIYVPARVENGVFQPARMERRLPPPPSQ
jgi:drug/metabolite transporter (DMT)-like permease